METFLYYLLRASVLMALFYGFYKLFFGKNTFHNFNRFSLISVVMLIAVLPVFRFNLIPEKKTEPVVIENLPMDFSNISIVEISELPAPRIEIPWVELLSVIFVLGLLFALARYLIGLNQLIGIIRKSEKQTLADNTVLCVAEKDISPFSWMKYIVLSRKDVSADNRAIINHERAHINLQHSFDMIFFDLFTCVFWFNPFSWLLRREIQSVHEYQADEQVLNNGIDAKQYQLLLIRKSVGEHKFALANNFRQRDLHKRITMMMKNKTNKRMKWNYAVALPVLFLAMVALSVPKLNAKVVEKETENPAEQETISTPIDDSLIIANQTVDLTKNPLELGNVEIRAKENSEDEKLTVSGFVKGNEGFIPGVAVVIKGSSVGTVTDTQGKFVIEAAKGDVLRFLMVGYIASEYEVEKVQDNLVIVLQQDEVVAVGAGTMESLQGKIAGIQSNTENEKQSRLVVRGMDILKEKPLIIVDGVEVDTWDGIKRDDIESVTVLKDAAANSIYGDRAKDGVVLITTKGKERLIIIDGKKMPKDFKLNSIQPDEIESINVLKDQSATAIYGNEGKNGVVIITTKKNLQSNELQETEQDVTSTIKQLPPSVPGVYNNSVIVIDGEIKEKDFDINSISPKDIESISVLKDNSAVQLYGEKGRDGAIVITTKNPVKSTISLNGIKGTPLIVVDGVKMSKDFELNSISPNEIESISVLKDKAASEVYGDEGKNGVVIITKKKTEK